MNNLFSLLGGVRLRSGLAFLLIAAALTGVCAAQGSADVALQAAIHKEVVDGDLPGAIQAYEAIARGNDRAAAAQALLRMGRCYERLGEANARKTYERVVAQFADQKEAAKEAWAHLTTVGWYNGDRQSGIPGLPNWYVSERQFARVYDDFVVPDGGWTVVGVFSSNGLYEFPAVTQASWEIRSDMAPGRGGKLVASGIAPATQSPDASFAGTRDRAFGFVIRVDGLRVQLVPGRYWLSVAPVGTGKGYVSATRGRSATGDPRGNNGQALFSRAGMPDSFVDTATVGRGGQLGIGTDFSLGVVILNASK